MQHPNPCRVQLGGRGVEVTEVFWAYWYLAAERQAMFMHRVNEGVGPSTSDPILAGHRFTNAYRASDRVSQYLLQRVIYNGRFDAIDTVFRVLLFKIFNRVETWEHLRAHIGEPSLEGFDAVRYARALDERFDRNERLYSAAYIMPSPALGHRRKHANHLALLDQLRSNGTFDALLSARSLGELFDRLLNVPSFGPFLAFQYAIDLNYGPDFYFSEMEFVVAGPGALRGIAKSFVDTGGLSPTEVISCMTRQAPEFFSMCGLEFDDLWGRPLQLIDCQNLFCEVDKYARVAFPYLGRGGPTRIKQKYSPVNSPIILGYPPKWGLPWSAEKPITIRDRSRNAVRTHSGSNLSVLV